jgi:exopolysaccharide biosynthesis WecB/TagA/CpsF family protein
MSSADSASRSGPSAAPDLKVNLANMDEALDAIATRTQARQGYTLFTANLDHLVKLGADRRFREAYHRADLVTADGWPIVWRMKQDGHDLQRTTGADLLEPVCRQAAEQGASVYFVGPGAQSQALALDTLTRRLPGFLIAGREAPRFAERLSDEAADEMAARIAASGARLCIVSLGAPKQELLADMLHARCPGVGFLCFGAALDFVSGHTARAPVWMQRAGLEWSWRLMSSPGRMATRYARCAVWFVALALPGLFPSFPRLVWIAQAARDSLGV